MRVPTNVSSGCKRGIVRSEEVCIGKSVRVRDHHRIAERRGMVGRVVDRYGGEEYVAVDVRLSDGEQRLFWPVDLEEVSSPQPSSWCSRWRSLLRR